MLEVHIGVVVFLTGDGMHTAAGVGLLDDLYWRAAGVSHP